ncbi:hypothetical protein KEJ15_01710 [Candidatus Bathyarchaeota archaeon]|nr:hypothetical protein [Candidatus Bathyarchaeota archaeon]
MIRTHMDHYPLMNPYHIQEKTADTVPPLVKIISPQNTTYYSSSVSLTYFVNETVVSMAYSLDNESSKIITGNTTLSGLANGTHIIIVYVKDHAGNFGVSEKVQFTLEYQESHTFSAEIIAAVAGVAVSASALCIYVLKKKKGK